MTDQKMSLGLDSKLASFGLILFSSVAFLGIALQSYTYFYSNGFCSGWGTAELQDGQWAVNPGSLGSVETLPLELDLLWPFPLDSIHNITCGVALLFSTVIWFFRKKVSLMAMLLWLFVAASVGAMAVYQNYSSCRLLKSHRSIERSFPFFLSWLEGLKSHDDPKNHEFRFEYAGASNGVRSYEIVGRNGDAVCAAYIVVMPDDVANHHITFYPHWISNSRFQSEINAMGANLSPFSASHERDLNIRSIVRGVNDGIKYYSVISC